MSLAWDDATFQSAYRLPVWVEGHPKYGQTITYGRDYAELFYMPHQPGLTYYEDRWTRLTSQWDWDLNSRILVVGCGFGFLIEVAHDAGYTNIWGLDNSHYISSKRGVEARGDVLMVDDDIRGEGRIKTALRTLTGDDTFGVIITEDVLTSYDIAEMPPIFAACEAGLATGNPASNIIHMVSEGPINQPFTSLTLEEWQALAPTHSWIACQQNRWRVL